MAKPEYKHIRDTILSHLPCPNGCTEERSVEELENSWSLICYDCDSETGFTKGKAEADKVFEELKTD